MKKKKPKRSLARFALKRATRLFLFRQIFSTIGSVAGNFMEKQYGSAREHSPDRWKDRIHTLNVLLDADPAIRDNITRLTTWLYQQNRHEDLCHLQQFLTALDEPPEEGAMSQVLDAVAGILGKSGPPAGYDVSQRVLVYISSLVGDTGTEADFTAAVNFLEANRIIGFPPEKPEKGSVSAKIAGKIKAISGSLDKAGSWFQSRTRGRRRRSPITTPK